MEATLDPVSVGGVGGPSPVSWRCEVCCRNEYGIAVDLAVGLGLRQGEVFGLSPDDVDPSGFVEVRRQVKVLGRNKLILGLPKGNKVRPVPLPVHVAKLLQAHLAERPARRVTLPWGHLLAARSRCVSS